MDNIVKNKNKFSSDNLMFNDIERLWSTEPYKKFQYKLKPKNLTLMVLLHVFSLGIRYNFTCFLCIVLLILFHPNLRIFSRDADLLFYGNSKNNKRVFKKLNKILADKKYTKCFGNKSAPLIYRIQTILNLKKIQVLTNDLIHYKKSDSFFAFQLLTTAAARIYFEKHMLDCKAKILILANDHSPMQVGIRDASHELGIHSIYCQHAPISKLYPPLKFSLSILSDQASLSTYKKCGSIIGETTILASFDDSFISFFPIDTISVVGFCLSKVWSKKHTIKRLKELCAHPTVRRIILRSHPENDICIKALLAVDDCIEENKYQNSVMDFANSCDLIVVPGSGITIELLHYGKACIYLNDIDQLGSDPHNFVSVGLLPDYSQQSLSDLNININKFFNDNWLEIFKQYDPTISYSINYLKQIVRIQIFKLLNSKETNN